MGKKRAATDTAPPSKKHKRQDDDGEDVDCASLDFSDALSVGLAFVQLGAYDSASEAFARAVTLEPSHYGARCELADALVEAEEHAAALEHYTAASAMTEAANDASLWLRLGFAYAATGKNDEALTNYSKAKDLARVQLRETDSEDVRRTHGMALAAMANVLGMEKGDLKAAVDVYEDAVAAFPHNANLHFNLATMRLASGAKDQAIADLRRAIEVDASVVEFYEELVELLEDGEEKNAMMEQMEALRQSEQARDDEETKEDEKSEEESDEETKEEDEDESEDEEDDDKNDE